MANDFDSTKLDLEVIKGTTFDTILEVWDTDDNAILTNLTNLTGWTASWTVRECIEQTVLITTAPTIDTVASTITMALTATQTGTLNPTDYEHSLRITKGAEVRQLVWGPLRVKA
jgi:hypothetical protein